MALLAAQQELQEDVWATLLAEPLHKKGEIIIRTSVGTYDPDTDTYSNVTSDTFDVLVIEDVLTHIQGDVPLMNFDPNHKKFVLATRGNIVPRDCMLNITESSGAITTINVLYANESSAGANALYIVVGL